MNKSIKKKIYGDAFHAMRVPIVIHTLSNCFSGLLSVLTAGVLGDFADSVFQLNPGFGVKNLLTLALALAAMIFLVPAVDFIGDTFMLKYSLVHDRMVLGRFLDKRYDAVVRCEAGDIQNRLDWDPTELRCYLVEFFYRGLMIPLTLACLLYRTLSLSLLYTLIVLVLSLLKLVVPLLVKKASGKYDRQTREYASEVRSHEAGITGRPYAVRLFGLKDAFLARMERLYRAFFRETKQKSIRLTTVSGAVTSFIGSFCTVIILLCGAVLVARGSVSPGAVAAMYGYFAVFNTIFDNAAYIIRKMPLFKNIAGRMVLFYEDEETNAYSGEEIPEFREIRADGLSFSYEGKEVFNNVSFAIHAGESTAVCGENGCGKSTLLKLLLGLNHGYGGSLRVDGRELSTLNLRAFRRQIAYAPQDPYLFRGTVAENIRLGNPAVSDDEFRAFIDGMGLSGLAERVIHADGSELSGGERQKISLARALLKDTPWLFLDEPNNNLDSDAARRLAGLLTDGRRTVVYVSHDASLSACAMGSINL